MAKAYKSKKKKQLSKSKTIEINDGVSSTSSLLSSLCPLKDIEIGEIDKIPPIYIGRKRNYFQSLLKKEIKEKKLKLKPMPNKRRNKFQAPYNWYTSFFFSKIIPIKGFRKLKKCLFRVIRRE